MEKASLDLLLKQVCPAQESKDGWIWAFNKSGAFSTKSVTLELDKLGPLPQHDAIKDLWRGLVPHWIEVFVWTTILEKINTRSKLAALSIIPIEEDICPLCASSPKSSAHLLLHCSYAHSLWNWCLDLWRVKWVFPSTLHEAFDQWQSPKNALLQKGIGCNFFHYSMVCVEGKKSSYIWKFQYLSKQSPRTHPP